ncbi:MAG: hypothetical protein J0L57_18585 [Burkholderiales bacterium]|nr:hypothetical protein [Burkholderiales bacterium]
MDASTDLMPLPMRERPVVERHADGRSTAVVTINGRPVELEWSRAAALALAARRAPLVVELELLFSCLVRKTVRFHDVLPNGESVAVTDMLRLCFRPVTAQACTMERAEHLGRQPVTPIDTPAARRLAPRRVRLDHARGRWWGEFGF